VRDQQNGLDSVDGLLHSINATDAQTGQPIHADDVFVDWTIANYLRDGSVADGRYDYKRYANAPQASDTDTVYDCPLTDFTRTVNQYGTDYIKIECQGKYTLRFTGAQITRLVPTDVYSGKYAFWSNKGDESDMTLTHEFDFTDVSGPLELTYQAWYDLEKDYDYVYLEASTDGQNWTVIKTPSGTDEDLSGNSYGWGYNGTTESWIKESVDLSQFAGQKVQIRFEYVTDAAVNAEGFLLDDVSVPALNYFTDFETDDGGWQAAGFARIQNLLPQTFRLTLILEGAETTVQTIPLNPDQTAEISLDQGLFDKAILVVSGTTRFTRDVGQYAISIK
jgi:immune inhibitor A